MSAITLESLGLTQDELANRVVAKIADSVMTGVHFDEDGEEYVDDSKFMRTLNQKVQAMLDAKVDEIGEKHVLPKVTAMVENLVLQETNKWGEKRGEPVTFVEYMVGRAEAYMKEPVNYEGKTKEQSGSYSFSATQTRVTNLIEKHLHYSIDTAMKAALNDATTNIAKGINETVRLKLNEAIQGFKVTTAIK